MWTDPDDPPDYEPVVFKGEDEGDVGVLYPVGAAYWTWEEKTPEASTEARTAFDSDPACECGYRWPAEGAVE